MYDKIENQDMRAELLRVCDAIKEEGYDPVVQLSGYILSEDPIYIPNTYDARKIIRRLDRDELLAELIRYYLG